jgi:hypothetical protein
MTTFLLGTHKASWLTRTDVPLFVSDRTLRDRRTMPTAAGPWALDSGGFTELQKYGRWTVDPSEYVARVRRYRNEIGGLAWAAPQDWMCEPIVIAGGVAPGGVVFAGTKLSVEEHQRRTVANYLELAELAPDLNVIPVLQGYHEAEYHECVDRYAEAGVDLRHVPLVGLGSVCRRQATHEAHRIILGLRSRGVTRLHGFGVKTVGLREYGHLLTSADSLAWSYGARKRKVRLPGCEHATCANCLRWALRWREDVLRASLVEREWELPLWDQVPA